MLLKKCKCCNILVTNNKGADQTARVHRLICVFAVRIFFKPELVHLFEINLPKFLESKGQLFSENNKFG